MVGSELHGPEPMMDRPSAAMGAEDPYVSVPELGEQPEFFRTHLDEVGLPDLAHSVPVPLAFVELVPPPVQMRMQLPGCEVLLSSRLGVIEGLQRLPDVVMVIVFEVLDFLGFHTPK